MSMTSDQAVELLRAAGEPTRMRILALLSREELAVLELTRILGQSQPRVSRHLKLLALISPSDATLRRDGDRLAAIAAERAGEAARYFAENAERWDEIRSLYTA